MQYTPNFVGGRGRGRIALYIIIMHDGCSGFGLSASEYGALRQDRVACYEIYSIRTKYSQATAIQTTIIYSFICSITCRIFTILLAIIFNRRKTPAVLYARAMGSNRLLVKLGSIALMLCEAIHGVLVIHLNHNAVTGNLHPWKLSTRIHCQ